MHGWIGGGGFGARQLARRRFAREAKPDGGPRNRLERETREILPQTGSGPATDRQGTKPAKRNLSPRVRAGRRVCGRGIARRGDSIRRSRGIDRSATVAASNLHRPRRHTRMPRPVARNARAGCGRVSLRWVRVRVAAFAARGRRWMAGRETVWIAKPAKSCHRPAVGETREKELVTARPCPRWGCRWTASIENTTLAQTALSTPLDRDRSQTDITLGCGTSVLAGQPVSPIRRTRTRPVAPLAGLIRFASELTGVFPRRAPLGQPPAARHLRPLRNVVVTRLRRKPVHQAPCDGVATIRCAPGFRKPCAWFEPRFLSRQAVARFFIFLYDLASTLRLQFPIVTPRSNRLFPALRPGLPSDAWLFDSRATGQITLPHPSTQL